MSKPAKSQWDFGELFPAESRNAGRKVLSVWELTSDIKRLLEKQIGSVWVGGAVELRAVQPRKNSAARPAGGRSKSFIARRRDGLRGARAVSTHRPRGG